MSPSNDLFFAKKKFSNASYNEKILLFRTKLLYFLSVFIICIESVFNRCPDLPVVFTGFFENCSVFTKDYIIFQLIFLVYTHYTQLTTNAASAEVALARQPPNPAITWLSKKLSTP